MFQTDQENFWNGAFGDAYIERNCSDELHGSNLALFSEILSHTEKDDIQSVFEIGANIGLNLKAIKMLSPKVQCSAVEINEKAVKILREFLPEKSIYQGSIIEYDDNAEIQGGGYDFVFTKGVLIHINPEMVSSVYEKIYNLSKKYICIIEYYNPVPVMVKYRDFENKLFKRDFAGEMLEKYPDLRLIKYGFCYHRDNNFPQDDLTWFLIKKG